MADVDALIAEADRELERNNFSAARDLYRKALHVAQPARNLLDNLSVAEEEERLQFRRALRRTHPDSLEVRLSEAALQLAAGRPRLAVPLYTSILAEPIEAVQRISIHVLRYRAAIRARSYQIVLADFCDVWFAGESHPGAEKLRPSLLRQIATIDDVAFVPILHALRAEPWLPESVDNFVKAKIEELQRLEQSL